MMRPRTYTLVAGHPVVAVPAFLLHAGVGAAYTYDQGFGWFSLYVLVFLGWLTSCWKERARYRAWQREWDSLDPNSRPRQPILKVVTFISAFAGGLFVIWLVADYRDPGSPAHAIAPLIALGLGCLALVRLAVRRRRPGRATSKVFVVTQAIGRPLSAPPASEAYARLPDYCRPLFSSEPQRKEQS